VVDRVDLAVTPDHCRGTRDRSWGVRPVGARDGQDGAPPAPPQFFWIWSPTNFEQGSFFFHTNDDGAVICRSGGEEFVIADIWQPDEVSRKAQQICDVIAALPFGISASIGTAGVHPADRPDAAGDLLTELVSAADAAMYIAKRRGGNQAGHHEWPLPTPLERLTDDETETGYRSDGISA